MSSPILRRVIGMMAKAGSVLSYATLNPSDKGANVSLSGGNLIAVFSGNGAVRSTLSKSSGKWYWEVKITSTGTGTISIGVQNSSGGLSTYIGIDANGWGYLQSGNKFTNGSPFGFGSAYTTNDVIGVALDMDAGNIKFYLNNTLQGTAFSSLTGSLFPAISAGGGANGEILTANFGASAFTYSPPSGYNPGVY